ncbi:MAG: isoprenylcysteine carboxylmethyltransferase family protein, partial [Chlorobiales bacterium]|nr:isoprenylcysteine carboxylmethyltransferase family protein [Chlorobiales bacterium]
GIQAWDKTLLRLYIVSVLVYLVFTGLDIGRIQWLGGIPVEIRPAGGIFLLVSLSLVYWAMLTNQFFSTVVRLQEDRGQYVVTTGPYRFVRHPGYLSVIGTWIGFSVMVGSWIALLSTAIPAAVMIVRTIREDRFLQEQLAGYEEYCRKVRWRLMPYVW